MGLDITAHSRITRIEGPFDADGEPVDAVTGEPVDYAFRAYVNPDFNGREGDIKNDGIYVAEASRGFCAGSYGGYNAWRNELAKLGGYPEKSVDRYKTGNVQFRHDEGAWAAESGPFWELINFSDCEGVIGSEVAAKLANDFAEYQEKAEATQNDFFIARYNDWRKAFEMAADNGAVDFH